VFKPRPLIGSPLDCPLALVEAPAGVQLVVQEELRLMQNSPWFRSSHWKRAAPLFRNPSDAVVTGAPNCSGF
jgi:hypothetical protein